MADKAKMEVCRDEDDSDIQGSLYRGILHPKLSTRIPNKKELHLTAHAPPPVGATELPVYPVKSLL